MAETVATPDELASPDADPTEDQQTATPPAEDAATILKRLRGKDQALTAAQQRVKDLEREREELARWKAEREGADMTEMERALQRAEKAEAAAAKAEAEAAVARAAAKYPQGYPLYQDWLKVRDDPEAFMAFLQGIAKQDAADATEEEPSVNLADRPRRVEPAKPTSAKPPTKEELAAAADDMYRALMASR